MSSNENRSPDGATPTGATSGKITRPIDAPSLPPWLGKPRASSDDEDDAPTQNMLLGDVPGVMSAEDPRALARRLAEEAKQRMPARPVAVHHEEPSMSGEDPRELARRLAEEAKRRLRDVPPPVDEPLDELFADEPAGDTWTSPPEDEIESSPSVQVVTRPLSERATGSPTRPMSALEALAAAREAERNRTVVRSAPPPRAVPSPSPSPVPRPASPETNGEPVRAPGGPAPLDQVEAIVRQQLPAAEVRPAVAITSAEVFRALWRAHRARAQHEGDVALVATASVLLEAIDRVPAGWIAATRLIVGGRHTPPETWAVWVDLERRTILAVARPADVYLAGT